jgi:hypothetical protein
MHRKRGKLHSVLIILGLMAALAFVIYAMRYTQSQSFQSSLEGFFGMPGTEAKAWNWCPENAEEIQFLHPQSTKAYLSLSDICSIQIEPVTADMAKRTFKRLLTVTAPEGQKTLESDAEFEVFQVDGLIFKSKKLSAQLK